MVSTCYPTIRSLCGGCLYLIPELQIREGIEDNSKITFLMSHLCCDPSLELSRQDSSNDGS